MFRSLCSSAQAEQPMENAKKKAGRNIPEPTKVALAARAAGRCEYRGCNKFLYEHHLTKRAGNFAQNAHIFAFSPDGPRGRPASSAPHDIGNLMLLCPECHKLVDDNHPDYAEDLLRQYKKEHEARVFHVTGLGPELRTHVVIVRANVGGQPTVVPTQDAFDALLPRYPAHRDPTLIDFTSLSSEGESFYSETTRKVESKIERLLQDTSPAPSHISVFGLAPMPLLAHVGFTLGSKVPTDLYQRHRDTGDWRWKGTDAGPVAQFELHEHNVVGPSDNAALVLSLSGDVSLDHVRQCLPQGTPAFVLRLASEAPHVGFLRRREDLLEFALAYRSALTRICSATRAATLHLFPAVPAPIAITCGQVLLPKVHPEVLIHDFHKDVGFQPKVRINCDKSKRLPQ